MSDQPKALRLADELMDGMNDEHWNQLNADAAAELRRLHALNAELVEALQAIMAIDSHSSLTESEADAINAKARAALAKAEASNGS